MNKILIGLLVTAMTVSLVTSSVVFLADSADADRDDKIKEKVSEKIKKALDKIKERTGNGGHGPVGDPPGGGGLPRGE